MKHFNPANILLPKKNFDKWAVVACDQYTSEPEYWNDVEAIVGDEPSALHIILPEIYLSDDNSARINDINANMQQYLDGDPLVLLRRFRTRDIPDSRGVCISYRDEREGALCGAF